MNNILEIMKQASFNDDFINYVEKNYCDEVTQMNPYDGDYPDYPIIKVDSKERLDILLKELLRLQEGYIERGIPLSYFYDSIEDLNFRSVRYFENHGTFGLTVSDTLWLRFVYFMEMFDIGTMRFQRFWFSYEEIERGGNDALYLPLVQKKRFPEGTPIINIHIRKGATLNPKAVDNSFKEAKNFFEQYFSDHEFVAFVGRSWMFYPKMLELLNKESNIYQFAKRFEIIATSDNRWQALYRIYGTYNLDMIEDMEKVSSLQKNAYLNIEKLGVGVGVIAVDDI